MVPCARCLSFSANGSGVLRHACGILLDRQIVYDIRLGSVTTPLFLSLVAMATVVANRCIGGNVGVVRVNNCTATYTNSKFTRSSALFCDIPPSVPLEDFYVGVRAVGRDSTSVLKFALKRAFSYFSFLIKHILKLLINLLGRYARVVDHLAVRDVAQGAPLGGGSTLHPDGELTFPFITTPVTTPYH